MPWGCLLYNNYDLRICLKYDLHLHLQSGEQSNFALMHLHLEQSPLHAHWISSLHDCETSGLVIQIGTHESVALIQLKSSGEGSSCCGCVHDVQIPAW